MDTYLVTVSNKTKERVEQAFEMESENWETAFAHAHDSYFKNFDEVECPEEEKEVGGDDQNNTER